MLESLKNFLKDYFQKALGSYDQLLVDTKDILTGTGLPTGWEAACGFAEELKVICYIIIAVALTAELAQTAMKVDMLKWEHGLKVLLKMVLAKVAIDEGIKLLKAIYLTAAEWTSNIFTAPISEAVSTGVGDKASDTIGTYIEGLSGWGSVLGLFISLAIVVLAINVCGVLIKAMAYARIFEILMLVAVAPLAFAFLPLAEGGSTFSGITMKYVKSFAASCLQSVLMIISIRIFGVLMDDMLQQKIEAIVIDTSIQGMDAVTEICFLMLLGVIVLVMSIIKSGSLAKQILNAM